jgi:hypothetical protein
MSATTTKKTSLKVVIVKKMKDYSKEPFFIKKAEDAKAILKKYGLPKFLPKDK